MTLKQQHFATNVVAQLVIIASFCFLAYALTLCFKVKQTTPNITTTTNKVEAITPEQWLYMGAGQ